MFRTLIASLTRKPTAPLLTAPRPLTLALVPVATERRDIRGYSYGRANLRAQALAARSVDRAWS